MEYALMANKFCKQVKNWRSLLLESSKLLLTMKKYEEIANFASKVYISVEELIASLSK